jgi:hypothetical protein
MRLESIFIRFFEHNLNVFFPKQLSLNGRYLKKNNFYDFQIFHIIPTHFDDSISEIKSMCSVKVFTCHI